MKPFALTLFSILCCLAAHAMRISGQVNGRDGQPLAFASITIKGTALGTSANSVGFYSLDVRQGKYTIVVQHVGYKTAEQQVTVAGDDVYVDFVLDVQQYELGSVTVKAGEDPALEIIRNAIAKRSYYQKENKSFQVDVYIKGRLQLRDFPTRFFGQKVDFEDGDTSKKKVIFLSETVAKYSVENNNAKVEVLSTKVSGQSDAFGFSNPQILSFYDNIIEMEALNPRGFVSPIADNALGFYRYKFEGTFFEGGKMINRIKVMPRRTYSPLFNGYINIVDNEWRIHSLQLNLYKENQMQFADTLMIEQLYVPLQDTWVIKQQTLYPSFKVLGFDGFGSFVQVYDHYDLSPTFPKKYFNNTILKVNDSANKKSMAYWDSIRPIPLVDVEIKDYQKKDSLEQARNDPHYLDSLDKRRNKINVAALITTGQTFSNQKRLSTLSVNSLISAVNYNTVEGLVLEFEPSYSKKWSKTSRNRLTISPLLRYGFSNNHFNGSADVRYNFGKKYASVLELTAGSKVYQFDNRNPISSFSNTLSTLYWERNYLKIYEAETERIAFRKSLGDGFSAGIYFERQDRKPLVNTTLYKWRDLPDRTFSPNLVVPNHQSSIIGINIRFQPGAKYIELPERKIMIGSSYPVLTFSFTKGINKLLGSDVDFARWKIGMSHEVNLKLKGEFKYNISAGGFLSDKRLFLPDYNHYIANRFSRAVPYLTGFQLMDYYTYSNTAKIYGEQHSEYHLNGFVTNIIPGFKKLNWFLVTGDNLLYINGGTLYGECFIGLENILKVGRVDFVQSFTQKGWQTSGVRFTFLGMLR